MNATVFLPIAFTIAAALTYLFLAGDAALTDVLARWQADRESRRGVAELDAQRRALAGPRSVPNVRRR